MSKFKSILIFIFFSLQTLTTYSQDAGESVPLLQFLKEIEKDFSSNFSYADAAVEGIFIDYPGKYKSLEEALDFLKKNTPFDYTLLRDNIIAVSPVNGTLNYCGFIFDLVSGLPISGASINSDGQKVLSDSSGKFTIKLPKNADKVTVNYIGFKSLELSFDDFSNTSCPRFYLVQQVEPLDLIFLQNYITKGITKTSTGELQISYRNFGILPGLVEPDVLQTIQALPGIISSNETVSYLNVRGGTHDQNLFLWDGIKMYQTSHFFGMISAFNPYLTEEVSLIKNGSSVVFGDGVSSVISMKTSQELNDSLKVSAGLNMINADIYLDTPLSKKASIQLAARSSYNDLLETPTYRQYFNKVFQNSDVTNSIANATDRQDDFSFFDTSLRGLFQLSSKDFLRANFLYTNNDLFVKQDEFRTSLIQSRVSNLKQTNLASGIFYERKWNDKLKSNVQLYGSNYTIEATNLNVISEQKLSQENDVKEWGAILGTDISLNTLFSLKTGYQINETAITNFEETTGNRNPAGLRETLLTHSVYSEINYVSSNLLTRFRLGARANHISEFNSVHFEPRLSFNQRFWNFFTLEVLAEKKSQTTSQVIDFQTDFLGVENRRWVLSKPDEIPILISNQLSLGLNYKQNGLLLNAEAYIKKIDGITTQSQGFQNQFQFIRTHGSYEVMGIDFLLHKDFNGFSGWLSYSISENNYFFEDLDPQYFHNNIDITNVVALGLSYDFNRIKLSTGFNWHTGRPTTLPVENEEVINNEIQYNTPNSSRLPEYFRIDLSATYTFNLMPGVKAFTGVSLWNLLGNKNVYNSFYRLDREFELEKIDQTGLGFTPNFTFRVTF
ncbi:MAG: TonB-dependent receptor [Flavobacteriaceae bacterium]